MKITGDSSMIEVLMKIEGEKYAETVTLPGYEGFGDISVSRKPGENFDIGTLVSKAKAQVRDACPRNDCNAIVGGSRNDGELTRMRVLCDVEVCPLIQTHQEP